MNEQRDGARTEEDGTPGESQGGNEAKTLLDAWRRGEAGARDRLFELLYVELRQVSAALLRSESNASLSTGDLVNESVMRLMRIDQIEWADKAHFLALAARAMRRALIDHARRKSSDKRGHDRVTLVTGLALGAEEDGDTGDLDLDRLEVALERLGSVDPPRAEIVEMRFFGGMTLEEIAQVTGRSISTIKRGWRTARAWLLQAMDDLQGDSDAHE